MFAVTEVAESDGDELHSVADCLLRPAATTDFEAFLSADFSVKIGETSV
jgi:hypothetical protein